MSESENLLELRGIVKEFPSVRALDRIDFNLRAGEVHVLVGENGAGKSTLVKIIAGALRPDAGSICLQGQHVSWQSPREALQAGVATVYQELTLIPALSAARNIMLGKTGHNRLFGWINWRDVREQTASLLSRLNIQLNLDHPVQEMSIAQQQMVEIAKALGSGARVLLLDEPTSALTGAETQQLFTLIRGLQRHGVGIIYISHRLEEVEQIADRVTIMRDGAMVHTAGAAEMARPELIRYMVGRALTEQYPKASVPAGNEVLRVENLATRFVQQVNLHVNAGEIVGLAGLVGSGRSSVLRAAYGADAAIHGRILLQGRPVTAHSTHDAVANGFGFIPEDRKSHGLIPDMSVRDNMMLASAARTARLGFINRRKRTLRAAQLVEQLQVKTAGLDTAIKTLSGGNQQKTIMARWMAAGSQVLLMDEPTRGVDVGGKVEIYNAMMDMARNGVGILMVSSDLLEILGLCDRIYVMHEGTVTGELSGAGASEEKIMLYATGQQIVNSEL